MGKRREGEGKESHITWSEIWSGSGSSCCENDGSCETWRRRDQSNDRTSYTAQQSSGPGTLNPTTSLSAAQQLPLPYYGPSLSPGAPTVSPGAPTVSPGAPTVSPGAPTVSPGAPTVSPGAPTVSPGAPIVSPGAAAGVGTAAAGPVRHQADLPAVDVSPIQLVQGPLHVRVGAKLDHALIGALLVRVGVRDLAGLSHEVLPDTRAETEVRPPAWHLKTNFQVFFDSNPPRPLSVTLRSCQLQRLDRFSTISRYSVRTGGPYLSLPVRLLLL